MNSTHKLNEGMREGDLDDLVLPLLSIDEYVSKIGDDKEVIVVGFFVEDEDPANDLSRFIDRSVTNILDTDVSPAPNEEGYFLVFLEVKRDEKFVNLLLQVLDEISNLVNIKKWTFKVHKDKTIHDLGKKNLEDKVNTDPISFNQFEVTKFLKGTMLDDFSFENDDIIFEKRGMTRRFKFVCFEQIRVDKPLQEDISTITECNRIQAWLGSSWGVEKCDGVFILSKAGSRRSLLLKDSS